MSPTVTAEDEVRLATYSSPGPWSVVEAVFAASLLLAGTLGPVYRLNLELGGRPFDYAEDPRVVAVFAVFYLVAAILGLRCRGGVHLLPLGLSVVFVVILMSSSLWSVDRRLSAIQSVLAAMTLLSPWYLVRRYRASQVLALAWSATFAGILASLLLVVADDELALDVRGDWAGLYFNRNSLGMVAGLCTVLGLVCALSDLRGVPERLWVMLRIAAGASVPLAAVSLWGSGSRTALVSTVAALAVWGGAALLTTFSRRRAGLMVWMLLGVGAFVMVVMVRAGAGLLGSDPTLQGRTKIWSYLVDRVLDRPLTGDGWLATFGTLEFWRFQKANLNYGVQSAHNSLLEVAVGAGIIAAGILVVLLVMGLQVGVRDVVNPPHRSGALVVAVYFVVTGATETVVGANHLLWILFLAVCAYRWPGSARRSRGISGST